MASEDKPVEGWYGPPNSRRFHYFAGDVRNSRRFHYFAGDVRSLCGKWLVRSWSADLIDVAFGPATGDCAACAKALAARGPEEGEDA